MENPTRDFLGASQLVRCLADLTDSHVEITHKHFTERLARLIDFTGSITLSEAQHPRAAKNHQQGSKPIQTPHTLFLNSRGTIIKSMIKNFIPEPMHLPDEAPQSTIEMRTQKATDYAPYYKFYAAQQIEMNTKIQHLHEKIREIAHSTSKTLSELATLDAALAEVLTVSTRKFYSVIPKLLAKRFEQICNTTASTQTPTGGWLQPGGGFDQFCQEIRVVLLAELDVRLQPLLGLVEAINTEHNRIQQGIER